MIFLPHTNIVVLLEPYCGTITEPGLPVVVAYEQEFLLGTALAFAKRDISQNFSKFQEKVLGEISARLSHLSTFYKRISKRKEKLRNFNLRLH